MPPGKTAGVDLISHDRGHSRLFAVPRTYSGMMITFRENYCSRGILTTNLPNDMEKNLYSLTHLPRIDRIHLIRPAGGSAIKLISRAKTQGRKERIR
jgi:hypothetical protein